MRSLILGGVKSGKSRYAESLVAAGDRRVVYVATALPGDPGMQARIAEHRARRPAAWRTVECGAALAATLMEYDEPGTCLLVDCLTLWLTRLMPLPARDCRAELDALVDKLPSLRARVILVTNEVGLGVIPMGELSRRFVDEAGRLHQALAGRCEHVAFVSAGLPMHLKGQPDV